MKSPSDDQWSVSDWDKVSSEWLWESAIIQVLSNISRAIESKSNWYVNEICKDTQQTSKGASLELEKISPGILEIMWKGLKSPLAPSENIPPQFYAKSLVRHWVFSMKSIIPFLTSSQPSEGYRGKSYHSVRWFREVLGTREPIVGTANPRLRGGSPEGTTKEQAWQGPRTVDPQRRKTDCAPGGGSTTHSDPDHTGAKGTRELWESFVMSTDVYGPPTL